MIVLEAKKLKKYFASQKAVDDISFSIDEGQIFGLLGPNGAGKTTLIRMITGIFYPDEGDIFLDNKKFDPQNDVGKIGYMPEERGLYKKMKIGEQATYLAQLKGLSAPDAKTKIRYWFEKLGMDTWWDKKVEDLSKGMGQKLQFVTTIVHEPKLIILDEPFSGLDPVNANMIKDEIFELAKKGSTIIFSTHRMEQVEEICSQIILVNKGKKVLDGTVQGIKARFKENLFRINCSHSQFNNFIQTDLFSVIQQKGEEIIVQKSEHVNNNQILQYLLQNNFEVHGFNEILPSLNDIFIKQVDGTPDARIFTTT